MKKISREIKIGSVALITVVVLIWVWNFLKGVNILENTNSYYAVYSDVHGLIESGVVMLNGYKVGNVGAIQFDKDNVNRFVVKVNLKEKVKLPRNSVLLIRNSSIISGIKEIRIVLGEGPGFQEPGDTLIAATEQELSDLIGPIKDKASSLLGQLDSTLAAVNNILDVPTRNHLKSTLANLDRSVTELSASLEPGGELNSTFDNFASVSGNLKNNNENLSQTLQNISSISDSLQKADIKAVAEKADQTLAKLDMTLAKINNGEGSVGKLVSNDSLYNNLNSALFSLDSLLIDVKEHPKRYVHFSLFGKKEGK
jgi:phospholipid/cholesterol/gamma-HCH transport system substrate-binding protein